MIGREDFKKKASFPLVFAGEELEGYDCYYVYGDGRPVGSLVASDEEDDGLGAVLVVSVSPYNRSAIAIARAELAKIYGEPDLEYRSPLGTATTYMLWSIGEEA